MALINKCNFEILDGLNVDILPEDMMDNYFEVDDLIALPISLLNKKGYKTTFCCSGHPFDGITEVYAEDKEIFKCICNIVEIEEFHNKYRALVKGNPKECYITFGINTNKLPYLPSGFTDYGDNDIRFEYHSQGYSFDLIYEIVDTMKILYEWALRLPELMSE